MNSPHVSKLLKSLARMKPLDDEDSTPYNLREHRLNSLPVPRIREVTRQSIYDRTQAIQRALYKEFYGMGVKVIDYQQHEYNVPHSGHPPGNQPNPRCFACAIEERRTKGIHTYYYLVTLKRDIPFGEMVEVPKQALRHKMRRNQSLQYHRRIQKKWDKRTLGQTEFVPEQETMLWRFTAMQFKLFQTFTFQRK